MPRLGATSSNFNRFPYVQDTPSSKLVSTSPQSMIGAGVGSLTLASSDLALGASYRVVCGGAYLIDPLVVTTIATINLKLGSTTIWSSYAGGTGFVGDSNSVWRFDADFCVTTAGAMGAVQCFGFLWIMNNGVVPEYNENYLSSIDLSTSKTLDLVCTWDTSDANSNIDTGLFYLERII